MSLQKYTHNFINPLQKYTLPPRRAFLLTPYKSRVSNNIPSPLYFSDVRESQARDNCETYAKMYNKGNNGNIGDDLTEIPELNETQQISTSL